MLVIAAQENFEVEHWFELIGPGQTAVNSKGECFTIYIPDQWSRCSAGTKHSCTMDPAHQSCWMATGQYRLPACVGLLLTCIRSPCSTRWPVLDSIQWSSPMDQLTSCKCKVGSRWTVLVENFWMVNAKWLVVDLFPGGWLPLENLHSRPPKPLHTTLW